MIDVKKVTDVSAPSLSLTLSLSLSLSLINCLSHPQFEQPHRFDLVIINRVFQFYADSEGRLIGLGSVCPEDVPKY